MKLMYPSKGELPEHGQWVLGWLPTQPWGDSTDPTGVRFWKVLRFEKGLSQADRDAMHVNDPRKILWKREDEHANNKRSFSWHEFGPGGYFGQDVKAWVSLDDINEEAKAHYEERNP